VRICIEIDGVANVSCIAVVNAIDNELDYSLVLCPQPSKRKEKEKEKGSAEPD